VEVFPLALLSIRAVNNKVFRLPVGRLYQLSLRGQAMRYVELASYRIVRCFFVFFFSYFFFFFCKVLRFLSVAFVSQCSVAFIRLIYFWQSTLQIIVKEDIYTYEKLPTKQKAVEWYESARLVGGICLRPSHRHVNFADAHLFFGYGSALMAQDELQAAEMPVLCSIREFLLARQRAAASPSVDDLHKVGGSFQFALIGTVR
jgi:hypothetical protein